MTSFYNLSQLKQRRRMLRNQPIPSEVLMWSMLRGRKFLGLKFRRQYSVGRFIIDFYCPAIRLGVEIDGDAQTRPGQDMKDIARQRWIEHHGIKLIRFSSDDVMSNLDGVWLALEQAVRSLCKYPPPPV